MKPKPAFIGADCTAELNAKTAVDMHRASIIFPWHTELDDALRFHNALQNTFFYILWMRRHDGGKRLQDLPDSLMKLRLGGITFDNPFHQFAHVRILNMHNFAPFSPTGFIRELVVKWYII